MIVGAHHSLRVGAWGKLAAMDFGWLRDWRGAAAALLLSGAWALAFRRRPRLAGAGAGLGLALGWGLTLGLLTGSPRQLPERLPALAAMGAAMALLLAGAGRWLVALGAVAAVLAGAWWLAGGALTPGDLRRAGRVLAAVAVLVAALLLAPRGALAMAGAAAALGLGLWLGGPPGPWFLLAMVLVAAALGALPVGPGWGVAPALPLALGLAGLIAGPVLARGGTEDWLVAAAPLAVLWVGPGLGARFGGGSAGLAAGAVLAAGIPIIFLLWILHGP